MMTINELAALYGVTHRALRFYEDRGLLSPFRIGRQRMYSEDDAQKLSAILSAKRMGFALEEIKPLLVRGQSGWTLAISQSVAAAQLDMMLTRLTETQTAINELKVLAARGAK